MFSLSTTVQRRITPAAAPPPAAPGEPVRRTPLQNETWTPERIEQLKRGFDAGRSCAQIAGEIGVTRNAVIGKMNRMGLKRPKDVLREQLARARAERGKTPKSAGRISRKRMREHIVAQQAMPALKFSDPPPSIDIVPINDGRGRSLLELGPWDCRWPSGTPGAEDFCYCGRESLDGYPYCLGHASIAYRTTRRPRASVSR
jgi:GcrA cell cycle regulator